MSSTWKNPFALQMPSTPLTSSVTKDVSPHSSRSSTPVELSLPSPTHPTHSRYYIQDTIAVFLVDDCLFRVHRHFLDRESKIFPKGNGSTDEPINLPGVTKPEFESLLDFFYEGMHNEAAPPLSAWTTILSISTRFQMERVRARAIHEISSFWPCIDPVDQVVLAVKHNVPEWLPLAYAILCRRNDPIEVEEAKKLGLETMVLLAKAREVARSANGNAQHSPVHSVAGSTRFPQAPHPCSANPDNTPFKISLVDRVIKEIFWPASPESPEPERGEPNLVPEVEPVADPGVLSYNAETTSPAATTDACLPPINLFLFGDTCPAGPSVTTENNLLCDELNIISRNLTQTKDLNETRGANKLDGDYVIHGAQCSDDETAKNDKAAKGDEDNFGLPVKKGKKKKGKI